MLRIYSNPGDQHMHLLSLPMSFVITACRIDRTSSAEAKEHNVYDSQLRENDASPSTEGKVAFMTSSLAWIDQSSPASPKHCVFYTIWLSQCPEQRTLHQPSLYGAWQCQALM